VARGTVDVPFIRLKPSLELGFASATGTRTNGRSDAFTFDPDYQVGIESCSRRGWADMSARATDRVSDRRSCTCP